MSNKPFPDLRYTLGFRRFAVHRVKTPLVLISDNESFVSTAQKGRAHRVGQWCAVWHPLRGNPDSQSQETCQRVVAVVRASASLDVRGERVCRQTGGQRGRSAPALRVDYQENRRCQEFGQGCALPEQIHPGVSRRGPSQAPWTGRLQQTVCARACGWAQGGLRQMHQVPAGLRQEVPAFLAAHGVHAVAKEKCPFHPAAVGVT